MLWLSPLDKLFTDSEDFPASPFVFILFFFLSVALYLSCFYPLFALLQLWSVQQSPILCDATSVAKPTCVFEAAVVFGMLQP